MWWENDSAYRGNSLNDDSYFISPIASLGEDEDEVNRHWVHLSDKYKDGLKSFFKSHNDHYGLNLPKEDDLTSYNNPDYLWLSYELINIVRAYNNAVRNETTGQVLSGFGQIPYVQLRLQALATSVESSYPSSSLNSYGAEYKPHYVVEFEAPFLKQFMDKLFELFNDNPQWIEKSDTSKRVIYQFKAPIYRLEPFYDLFDTRHDIPGIVLHEAVKMLIYHELAHIGLGHLKLNAEDKAFKSDVDNIICEEYEADKQAVCWVLGSRFFDATGNKLKISFFDLCKELSISVFSMYLLFTWNYSISERRWNNDTLKNYGHKSHLPYQLRAYGVLNTSVARLTNLGIWCERDKILSSDDQPLTKSFFESVKKNAFKMVDAYETSLHMTLVKTETVCELFEKGEMDNIKKMVEHEVREQPPILKKEDIPWKLGMEEYGLAELERVSNRYGYVRERLAQSGSFCQLRPSEDNVSE